MQNVSERLAARGHEVGVIATTALSTEDYFLPGRGRTSSPPAKTIGRRRQRHARPVHPARRGRSSTSLRALANRIPFFPFGNRWRMLSWGPRSRAYAKALAARADADVIGAAPLPNMNVWYAWRAARKSGRPFVVIPCFHTEDAWSFHNPLYYKMHARRRRGHRPDRVGKGVPLPGGQARCRSGSTSSGAGIDLDGRGAGASTSGRNTASGRAGSSSSSASTAAHKGILDLL